MMRQADREARAIEKAERERLKEERERPNRIRRHLRDRAVARNVRKFGQKKAELIAWVIGRKQQRDWYMTEPDWVYYRSWLAAKGEAVSSSLF